MSLKKGDKVRVYGTNLAFRVVEEGVATLIKKDDAHDIDSGFERWTVRFDNEEYGPATVMRWVSEENKLEPPE